MTRFALLEHSPNPRNRITNHLVRLNPCTLPSLSVVASACSLIKQTLHVLQGHAHHALLR